MPQLVYSEIPTHSHDRTPFPYQAGSLASVLLLLLPAGRVVALLGPPDPLGQGPVHPADGRSGSAAAAFLLLWEEGAVPV